MNDVIDVPARVRNLPVDPIRKFPVPWFVCWIDGKPEFRVADQQKLITAIKEKRCWVCGEPLGRNMTFVAGSMCGLSKTSAEPPCHTDCARYSARACPFLTRPNMERREGGLDAIGAVPPDGHMIRRNPGVTLLWTTRSYALFGDGRGGILFRMGDPTGLEWFAEGRAATRAEVAESVRTGLPILEEMAKSQDEAENAGATAALYAMAEKYVALYPKT